MSKRLLIIIVNGGRVEEVRGLPRGFSVEVRDYDTDGQGEEGPDMMRDENGDAYAVTRW